MWCDGVVALWTHEFPQKKIISYLRRYEIWDENCITKIKFENIDALIFVAEYYKNALKNIMGKECKKSYIIHNGIDLDEFKFRAASMNNKKIAMVCSIKNVKNIPLAAQILLNLPEDYKIHHIGLSFNSQISGQIYSYIHNLGLMDRFISEGSIDRSEVPAWLEDKDFILSTSINEGNPNNIIEAMAMGIKPIIHNWPGAKDQFPDDMIFNTVDQAVNMIQYGIYNPERYRKHVEEKYSYNNLRLIHKVINDVY